MLKIYIDRNSSNVAPGNVISSVPQKQSEMNCEVMNCEEMNFHKTDPTCSKLQNSDILKDLDKKLAHLDKIQRNELKMLILESEHLFSDIPTRTDQIYHDVDIEGSKPIKQHPYRMNPKNCNISVRRFSICWTMTLLSLAKRIGVLFVFLCQNQMEHFVCALTTEK